MNAHEQVLLSRELVLKRATLVMQEQKMRGLEALETRAADLQAGLMKLYPLNHHLNTNARLMFLCLCDDRVQLAAEARLLLRGIEYLADQLTAEGVSV